MSQHVFLSVLANDGCFVGLINMQNHVFLVLTLKMLPHVSRLFALWSGSWLEAPAHCNPG